MSQRGTWTLASRPLDGKTSCGCECASAYGCEGRPSTIICPFPRVVLLHACRQKSGTDVFYVVRVLCAALIEHCSVLLRRKPDVDFWSANEPNVNHNRVSSALRHHQLEALGRICHHFSKRLHAIIYSTPSLARLPPGLLVAVRLPHRTKACCWTMILPFCLRASLTHSRR